MSFIPEKAMHHAHAEDGELHDDGKIVPINGSIESTLEAVKSEISSYGWVLGAVGAGVAVAAGAAALLSLRSSTPKKPARRRAARKTAPKAATAKSATAKTAAKKPATRRRTTAKKAATAAA